MILIECGLDNRPADFQMVAQHEDVSTIRLLGFSATGAEYTGDFAGFNSRIGTSNQLGVWVPDPEQPEGIDVSGTWVVTNATVAQQFNAIQDIKREAEYRIGVDRLLAEAWRKEIDGRVTGQDRAAAKQFAIDAVDLVKTKYPKVTT